MARIKIDSSSCNSFFSTLITEIDTNLTEAVTSFTTPLDNLNNSTTWNGTVAKTNMTNLIDTYNEFVAIYNKVFTFLEDNVPTIIKNFGDASSSVGGSTFSTVSVSFTHLAEKTIAETIVDGDIDGDFQILIDNKDDLKTGFYKVVDVFTELYQYLSGSKTISGYSTGIGEGSDFFDTSGATTDYANNILTDIKAYLDKCDQEHSTTIDVVIQNIGTVATNLQNV